MAVFEIAGGRRIGTRNGNVVGSKVWHCDTWAEIEAVGVPQEGDPWDELNPYLRVVEVDAGQEEAFAGRVEIRYSTEGQRSEEFFETSMDYGVEMLDTTYGMVWEDTGTVCDIPVATPQRFTTYVIKQPVITASDEQIDGATGKVNDRRFHNCPAGTLMFEGGKTGGRYNRAGQLLSASCTYSFTRRRPGHQWARRHARQEMEDGVYVYWQTKDAAKPWYDDGTLHKHGDPVFVEGLAGTSAWTRPKDPVTGDYRFESCDFATELGLPTLPGDDPPGEI
jgi:hypothetical protein